MLDENSLSGTIPRELGNLLQAGKLIHALAENEITKHQYSFRSEFAVFQLFDNTSEDLTNGIF